MINKAKEIMSSKEAKAVLNVVETVLDVAGKTLCGLCKAVSEAVKKAK